MSERPRWSTTALLVLVVNAACLGVGVWNRRGDPATTVELTERELGLVRAGEENGLLRLNLQYHDPGGIGRASSWADSASLAALGFDPDRVSTGHEVALPRGRPHRRPAWVLLRLDPSSDPMPADEADYGRSRLVPVAVGTNPRALLRGTDQSATYLVLRGVVGVSRFVAPPDSITGGSPGETWAASLDLVTPRFLHVPRSLVPVLDRLAPGARPSESPRYLVRVATGRLGMPWVVGIFPAVQ